MKGSGANQNILYLHKLLAFTNQSSFIASHTFRYPNIKSTPVLDFNWAHKCQESSTGGSAIYTCLSYQQSDSIHFHLPFVICPHQLQWLNFNIMNHLAHWYRIQYLELRRTKMRGWGGPEYPILGQSRVYFFSPQKTLSKR